MSDWHLICIPMCNVGTRKSRNYYEGIFFIILSLYTTGIAIVLYGIKYHFWQNSNAYAKVGISVFFIALAINCLVVIFGYLGSDISKLWWQGNVSLLVLVITGIAIKYFVLS